MPVSVRDKLDAIPAFSCADATLGWRRITASPAIDQARARHRERAVPFGAGARPCNLIAPRPRPCGRHICCGASPRGSNPRGSRALVGQVPRGAGSPWCSGTTRWHAGRSRRYCLDVAARTAQAARPEVASTQESAIAGTNYANNRYALIHLGQPRRLQFWASAGNNLRKGQVGEGEADRQPRCRDRLPRENTTRNHIKSSPSVIFFEFWDE